MARVRTPGCLIPRRFRRSRSITSQAATEGFSGIASPEDSETLFQLLHLMITAPRIDPPAFDNAVNEAEIRTSLAEADPAWQAWLAYNDARFDDARYRPVATRQQIESMSPESLLSIYRDRFGRVDDPVVAVVGDIEAAEAGRLARLYIGTLPAGGRDPHTDRRPAMPDGVVRRVVSADEGAGATLEIHHEAPVPVTPEASAAADLLEIALTDRLYSTVSEDLGASYTAEARIGPVAGAAGAYESVVYVTLDPARLAEVEAAVQAVIDDTAADGLTPDEFKQASAIAATDYSAMSNAEVLDALIFGFLFADGEVFAPQDRMQVLAALGPADVGALAGALYGVGGSIEIVTSP